MASAQSKLSDIVLMNGLELAHQAARVSCVEVMNAYLDHIARLNPKVNAIDVAAGPRRFAPNARTRRCWRAANIRGGLRLSASHQGLKTVKGIHMAMDRR